MQGGVWDDVTIRLELLQLVFSLTFVGKGIEVEAGESFGRMDIGQDLTSITLFSCQFCSQKAIIEQKKNHDFLLCATVETTHHLRVGGRESSQLVQRHPRGELKILHMQSGQKGATHADAFADSPLALLGNLSST